MKLGKGLTNKDLDAAIKILKSPMGKMVMPQMKTELEAQSLKYLKEQLASSDKQWTVEGILADIKAETPKMFEVFRLVGLSLEKIVQRAVDEKECRA